MSDHGHGAESGTHFNPEAPRRRSGGSGSWIEPDPMRPQVKLLLVLLAVVAGLAIVTLSALG